MLELPALTTKMLSRMMTDPRRVRRNDPGEPLDCPAFNLHRIYCTPQEIDYVQVTEAMVNIRATIEQALHVGMVEPAVAAELLRIAKSLFYKNRSYDAILKTAAELGLSHDALSRLTHWLPTGQIDQKRLDALEMLEAMRKHLMRGVSADATQLACARRGAF